MSSSLGPGFSLQESLTIIDRSETVYKYYCTSNCIGQQSHSARTDLVRAGARVGSST